MVFKVKSFNNNIKRKLIINIYEEKFILQNNILNINLLIFFGIIYFIIEK
jgi:hypothetical protein